MSGGQRGWCGDAVGPVWDFTRGPRQGTPESRKLGLLGHIGELMGWNTGPGHGRSTGDAACWSSRKGIWILSRTQPKEGVAMAPSSSARALLSIHHETIRTFTRGNGRHLRPRTAGPQRVVPLNTTNYQAWADRKCLSPVICTCTNRRVRGRPGVV